MTHTIKDAIADLVTRLEGGETGHQMNLDLLEHLTGKPADWKPGDSVEPFSDSVDSALEFAFQKVRNEWTGKLGVIEHAKNLWIRDAETPTDLTAERLARCICAAALKARPTPNEED